MTAVFLQVCAMDRYFSRKRKATTRLPLHWSENKPVEKQSTGFMSGVYVLLAFFQRAHVAQIPFYYAKLQENGATALRLEDKESLSRIKGMPVIVVTDNLAEWKRLFPDYAECWVGTYAFL